MNIYQFLVSASAESLSNASKLVVKIYTRNLAKIYTHIDLCWIFGLGGPTNVSGVLFSTSEKALKYHFSIRHANYYKFEKLMRKHGKIVMSILKDLITFQGFHAYFYAYWSKI